MIDHFHFPPRQNDVTRRHMLEAGRTAVEFEISPEHLLRQDIEKGDFRWREFHAAAAHDHAAEQAMASMHRKDIAIPQPEPARSEEHTSELQSLMRISYAVFCLKQKNKKKRHLIRKQLPEKTQH